jgi:Ca2+/H+ antiporter, TMEM165/GDT1 family
MNQWALAGTAFLASGVEFIEAATIVLAVGYAQSWRAALAGMFWACAALLALVIVLGPLIATVASVRIVEAVVGPFLVLYGIGWLRKAIWRFAGCKSTRDEQAVYDREIARLRADRERRIGFAVSFQGVFVEGLEVAIIIVTFGASRGNGLFWAFAGAAVALALVVAAAVALRKPFANVPENSMKAIVGVMLLSLGTLWTGEALGLTWSFGDATLFVIAGAYAALSVVLVFARRAVPA